ncbi:MAG: hypothetical protein ACFB10_20305 [Salibacteraceae bacterium]
MIAILAAGLTREWNSPWDRTIRSDGKGYYAYLPALLLHQDPTYSFEYAYEHTYYHHEGEAPNYYRQEVNGRTVNKYYPGLAILLLPFFLLSHIITLVMGAPPDGYGPIYQAGVAFAAMVYLWLGLRCCWALLRQLEFSKARSAAVLGSVFLGTNLFFYSLYGASFTHVYSFFLIGWLLWSVARFPEGKSWWSAAVALGLLVLVRPVNALILLFLPVIWGNWKTMGKALARPFKNWAMGLLLLAGLMTLLPLLWYWQSGQWIVDSYAGEGFDFQHPHWWEFLASFRKGWLLYTPLAIFALGGCGYLLIKSPFRWTFTMLFLIAVVWVFSSWSSWWYGGSFGQRPMVDFSAVWMLLLAWSFTGLSRVSQVKKRAFAGTVLLLVLLNQFQTWQYRNYILPNDNITPVIYAERFASFLRKTNVELPSNSQKIRQTHHLVWSQTNAQKNIRPAEGTATGFAAYVGEGTAYSPGIEVALKEAVQRGANHALVAVELKAYDFLSPIALVIEVKAEGGETLHYAAKELGPYLPWRRWQEVQFLEELPAEAHLLKAYLWDAKGEGKTAIGAYRVDLWSVPQ